MDLLTSSQKLRWNKLLVGFPYGLNKIFMASNEYYCVAYCTFHSTTVPKIPTGFFQTLLYTGLICCEDLKIFAPFGILCKEVLHSSSATLYI